MANDHGFDAARNELEVERARLETDLKDLGLGAGGTLSYDSNFADTSQVTAERGEAENLATELHEALEEVTAALARLEEGTYGICKSCGAAIAADRLEAFPTARLCIDCASKA